GAAAHGHDTVDAVLCRERHGALGDRHRRMDARAGEAHLAAVLQQPRDLVRAPRVARRRDDHRAGDAGAPDLLRNPLPRAAAEDNALRDAAVEEVREAGTRIHDDRLRRDGHDPLASAPNLPAWYTSGGLSSAVIVRMRPTKIEWSPHS